ncbi:MAG: hypothetical protein O6913_01855, partial [Chloroflexi bacterium]|nr:hypothetical protein [Chloroflexota bacterium]
MLGRLLQPIALGARRWPFLSADFSGQVLRFDPAATCLNVSTLERGEELPHVARPAMALQQPHGEWGAARVRASVDLPEKSVGEQRDVLFPRAPWWPLLAHDVPPIVPIAGEATRLHLCAKVAVG